MCNLVTKHPINYFYTLTVSFIFSLVFQVYTKKDDMKLCLVSMQEKGLAMCSESTGCALRADLQCLAQKETEPNFPKFAMEIQFCLTSLLRAVPGHLGSFLSARMFVNFNFRSSISPVNGLIQHIPGHATGKRQYRSWPWSIRPLQITCLVLRLGWI